MKSKVPPNDRVKTLRKSDFVVSMTDLKGRITDDKRIAIEFSADS